MALLTTKQKTVRGLDDKGRFVKGRKSERKGKPFLQLRGENHYRWVGGVRSTARTMAKRYGFKLNKCISCGATGDNMVVHHVDENFHNNKLENLRILCHKCHNQLHGNGTETRYKKGHKVSQETRDKIAKANTKHGRYAK
jgi:5-methylcytosine-specific restriction endonuclease McrA